MITSRALRTKLAWPSHQRATAPGGTTSASISAISDGAAYGPGSLCMASPPVSVNPRADRRSAPPVCTPPRIERCPRVVTAHRAAVGRSMGDPVLVQTAVQSRARLQERPLQIGLMIGLAVVVSHRAGRIARRQLTDVA